MRGWVRAIIRQRRLFEIFTSKGSYYWKEAINTIQYNTIQYKFFCELPMGAFQRQVLVHVINSTGNQKKEEKKYRKLIINKLLRNYK